MSLIVGSVQSSYPPTLLFSLSSNFRICILSTTTTTTTSLLHFRATMTDKPAEQQQQPQVVTAEFVSQAAFNGSWVCQSQNYAKATGIFHGDSPFHHPNAVLLAQLSLASLSTAVLQLVFNPLDSKNMWAELRNIDNFIGRIVGILLGPSIWGNNNPVRKVIFPLRSVYSSQTYSYFACMFYLFLVGVRTDLTMMQKSGKKALVIGFLTFIVPMLINFALAAIIKERYNLNPDLTKTIYYVGFSQAISSFHVVVCLLADLKLLNSELGRLATSSSLVSGITSWSGAVICFTINSNIQGKEDALIFMTLTIGVLVMLVVYILRPIMLYIVKQMTRKKAVKEDQIVGVFLMVLACSFFGEVIGQHMMLGPMMLGLAVPDGPPLGAALVNKMESFISAILLPSYFVYTGSMLDVASIRWETLCVVEILALSAFTGKLLATVLPSLYCKMPLNDALCLGLIMSAQGITDVLILQNAAFLNLLNVEAYTIISFSMVLITGITTPIIKLLYDPSKRYVSKRRRTVQHSRSDIELRMMACIYTDEQTPSIINLVDLANPSPKSPICFYVVHLLELSGRSAPLLVTHRPGKKNFFQAYQSEHIINAFKMFEQQNRGVLVVNLFTAISPYATMHDEVCSLAVDKKVSMIIIPFHRIWAVHGGGTNDLPRPVRSANRNILRNAPCSVSILIDRGTVNSVSGRSFLNVGMIFLDGPDDREALALALRMGDHPYVSVTVVRIVPDDKHKIPSESDSLDDEIINDFKIAIVGKKHHTFREEVVSDSVETVGVIRAVENSFQLILVGRRHDSNSALAQGLTEWNEFPELGFMGDMLASTEFKCEASVLVVQQQTIATELRGKDKFLLKDSSVISVDMQKNSGKVWPSMRMSVHSNP